ncbi:hypothetical protein MYAM1_003926 [Malassezia yamatoensis]|uniref:PIN domain-containing protein n=1 Tax=Malassezia yamatoensis TaxID=253288 RepID=A0AAJ5YVJ1_9BASI|nr:hypothetical protein MYAM1_003926 [Malassezia yamatoensis]
MSTYADYFNAQYQGRKASGPVLITFGGNEHDPFNPLEPTEEELMDQIDDEPCAAEPSSRSLKDSSHRSDSRSEAEVLPFSIANCLIWVLDTNVLLSKLETVQELFQLAFAASLHSSPILYMVIPHCVLEELDAMKHNQQRIDSATSVSAAARNASRWLLESVQQQKNSYLARNISRWALHVQTTATLDKLPMASLTNDQAIIALCSQLSERSANVLFITNDTNARTLAELQSISTLDLKHITQSLSPSNLTPRRLLALCAAPDHHYLFHYPDTLATLPTQTWDYLEQQLAQRLPSPDSDISMLTEPID